MIISTIAAGGIAVSPIIFQLTIFVLAIAVGYYVVWSVTPALHTPLMAVTNAISSVIIVGALIAVVAGIDGGSSISTWTGSLAVLLCAINIFGGFLVTQRMLAMYKKKPKTDKEPKEGNVTVWDTNAKGWRSFKYDRITKVEKQKTD